ncbi:MAG: P27 family phage terminase small subunit [Burkholderiaceae bacterium]|nr:P27 family phage terminase small subunit [Burkholderiaceae bacterium]
MGRHKSPAPFSNVKLTAPSTLSPRAREIFANIVGSVDPYHFTQVDMPLLCQYAGAADLCEQAQDNIDQAGAVTGAKVNPWLQVLEKASRSCVALSARLRICPQSRYDRLVAGTNARAQNDRKLWEPDDEKKPLTGLAYFRK